MIFIIKVSFLFTILEYFGKKKKHFRDKRNKRILIVGFLDFELSHGIYICSEQNFKESKETVFI